MNSVWLSYKAPTQSDLLLSGQKTDLNSTNYINSTYLNMANLFDRIFKENIELLFPSLIAKLLGIKDLQLAPIEAKNAGDAGARK